MDEVAVLERGCQICQKVFQAEETANLQCLNSNKDKVSMGGAQLVKAREQRNVIFQTLYKGCRVEKWHAGTHSSSRTKGARDEKEQWRDVGNL